MGEALGLLRTAFCTHGQGTLLFPTPAASLCDLCRVGWWAVQSAESTTPLSSQLLGQAASRSWRRLGETTVVLDASAGRADSQQLVGTCAAETFEKQAGR